uniref:NADH-ubiquinone oxidoreductase chain 3 n=1 Tax=Enchiridium sp. MTA_2015 TaxID=1712692 RepID=A0A0P0BQE8_9PLAT|nr:NADH dehydrogenase subunit 3 [Enchiridium sp. MTA_2015]ALI86928.1 NADH dehydrogenase subunit 3 [Enchiridium sp. MTA_2015]
MKNILIDGIILGSVLVILIFLWVTWTSRKNFVSSREKASPFECGFDPKDKARIPFSLRFFIIVILFIIFDVELSLLLQLPFQYQVDYFKNRLLLMVFIWILLLGTLEEWRRGVLSWKN